MAARGFSILGRYLLTGALCLWAGPLAGCNEDLPRITLVNQMSVLGARVEVIGDPEVSSPAPGQRVSYELSLVFPGRAPDLSRVSTLVVDCTPPDRFTGVPICREILTAAAGGEGGFDPERLADLADGEAGLSCEDEDFALRVGSIGVACKRGPPRLELALPDDLSGDERLVRGIVCSHGDAVLDPSDPAFFRCQPRDDASGDRAALEALPFYGTIKLARDDEPPNLHPDAAGLGLQLNAREWAPWEGDAPPTAGDCAAEGASLPPAAFGEDVRLDLRYDADLREEVDGEPELLQVSNYATAGELERRFTVWKPQDAPLDGALRDDLEWTAPTAEDNAQAPWRDPEDPVHFFFTLIDRRGGFALVERYLCLK